jgi:hypothetical protein
MKKLIILFAILTLSVSSYSQSVSHIRNKQNEVKGNKYFYAAYVYSSELKLDKLLPALYNRIKQDKFEDYSYEVLKDSLILADKNIGDGDYSYNLRIKHWLPSMDTRNKDLLELSVGYIKFNSDNIDKNTATYLKNYSPKLINELIAICNNPEFKQ